MRTSSLRRTARRALRSTTKRSALSRCKVTRIIAEGSFDDQTGAWTPPTTKAVYEGIGFLELEPRPYRSTRREDTVFMIETPMLRIPADKPGLQIGDVAEITECRDGTLLGRFWRVTGQPGNSYGVHRAYTVKETTALDVD